MYVAQNCFENMATQHFWSIADGYPDLVTCLHMEARPMGNCGLSGSVPWLKDTEGPFALFVRRISIILITFYLIVHSLKRTVTPFDMTYI